MKSVLETGTPLATGRTHGQHTEKQRLATQRNFALFLLRGMIGHLARVQPVVASPTYLSLQTAITNCIEEIERNPHVTTQE